MLIGILLPALGRAREASRAAKCLSNQRQIGIAAMMYANDRRDFIPREGVYAFGADPWKRPGWAIDLRPYLDSAVAERVNVGDKFERAPYYHDPSRIDDGHRIHYVVNAVPFLSPGVVSSAGLSNDNLRRGPIRISNIPRPAAVLYITEFAEDSNRAWYNTVYGGNPTWDMQIAQFYDVWYTNQFNGPVGVIRIFPKRHGNGGNAVFMDGHAEHVLAERLMDIPTWDDGIYGFR
jgi:prepilin-type processing-associated H-X9-DG protein